MARLTRPKHALCRRVGEKLCESEKCPVLKRNYPPGVHGPRGRGRLTEFGVQMREKQKAKRIYGILERQFKNYIKDATMKKGNTAENVMRMFEQRLDNVVFRLGFAKTREQARQMVSHGHIRVNEKKVSVPSYQVKMNDVITLSKRATASPLTSTLEERLKKVEVPLWLSIDPTTATGKVVTNITMDQVMPNFDLKAIVEYYSR